MDLDPRSISNSLEGQHHPKNDLSEGSGGLAPGGEVVAGDHARSAQVLARDQEPAQDAHSQHGVPGNSGVRMRDTETPEAWRRGYRIPRRSERREPSPGPADTAQLQGFSDSDDSDVNPGRSSSDSDDDSFATGSKRRGRWNFPGQSSDDFASVRLYDSSASGFGTSASGGYKLQDNSIFDPQVSDDKETLSEGQLEYLDKYVCDPVFDPALIDRLSKQAPTPKIVAQAMRKPIDQEILDFFPRKGASSAVRSDKPFMAISTRLGAAFGPLTHVWSDLRRVRDGEDPGDLRLFCKRTCRTLEKGMTLLGQTNNAVLFARRANLLSRFVKNQKKASDLIAKNQAVFGQRDALFGRAFHSVLYRKAKHNKALKEAQRLLAPPLKKFKHQSGSRMDDSHNSYNRNSSNNKPQYHGGNSTQTQGRQNQQPFRGGPPSRGRGNSRGGGRGKAQNSA